MRGEKGGGGAFYLETEKGGGVPRRGGRVGHTGVGRVSAGEGGGANFFFSGPNFPPSILLPIPIRCRFSKRKTLPQKGGGRRGWAKSDQKRQEK